MQLENLARAGAFDNLERNRARVFAGAETILRRAQASAEERDSGQIGLFGGGRPEPLRLPDLPAWPPMDELAFEAEAIGFHLTAHPLDAYAQSLRRLGVVSSNHLEQRAQSGAARIKLAGTVVNTKERITRTGSRMAWVRLSDSGGSYEVTLFSEVLSRCRELLVAGTSVVVTADIRLEGEALRVTANEIAPLDQAAAQAGAGMRVWLQKTEAVGHIRDLLAREGRGRGRVVLIPRLTDQQDVEIALPGGFNVSPRLLQATKMLPGVERVEDL
jgi:DNA polymerase-3 subunit alpha